MYELTLNDVVYQFNFGMGFMREVNKKVCTPVDGLKDVKRISVYNTLLQAFWMVM